MAPFALRRFSRFVVVGIIGFVVDGGGLALLSGVVGWNVHGARLITFLMATLTTWWLNRRHTFDMDQPAEGDTHVREYGRYIAVQIGGGVVNLGLFFLLIYLDPRLSTATLSFLPVAAGSVAGMFWNYFGVRRWVFRA